MRFDISVLEHGAASVAERICALQFDSYRQEARLLGIARFPPLERTVEDIRQSGDVYLGALFGEELLGVASFERQNQATVLISSLTVSPSHQREGVGGALIAAILRLHSRERMDVWTASGNLPAIALYRKLGFVERERRRVGPDLELVRFATSHSER